MATIQTYSANYPDLVGRRFIFSGSYVGPASYVTGGDPVQLSNFGLYIDDILSSGNLSVSGNYIVRAIPSEVNTSTGGTGGTGRPTWKLMWYHDCDTGNEVAAATNLSAEKFWISGFGGNH